MFETLGLEMTPQAASVWFGLGIGVLFGALAMLTRFCLRRALIGVYHTLPPAQLGYAAPLSRSGTKRIAAIAADAGGALSLVQAVVALLRCIALHDPQMAQRLCHDVLRTDAHQRAEIAAAIGRC